MEERSAPDDSEAFATFALSHDPSAFEALMAVYRDRIFDVALRITGDHALAEDVAQETFLTLYTHAASKPHDVPLLPWLLKVARNAALKHLRSRSRRDTREDVHMLNRPAPEQSLASAQPIEELHAALARLPEDLQLPVVMRYLYGMERSDIAAALGIPTGTVGSRISRAQERLRGMLLTSAGVALSLESLESALKSVPLAPAPASLNSLAALQHIASGAGIASKAALTGKVGLLPLSLKVGALTVAVAVVVSGALLLHSAKKTEPLQPSMGDKAPQQAAFPAAPPLLRKPSATLEKLLTQRLWVQYHRATLDEIGADLWQRVGLQSAAPGPAGGGRLFNLEEKERTVGDIVEWLATAGALELEYRDDTVLFWRAADDQTLAQLAEKLKDPSASARALAVYDLACLADRRVYPLLFKALKDPDAAVVHHAVRNLCDKHLATLRFGAELKPALQTMLDLYPVASQRGLFTFPTLMGATGAPTLVEALTASLTHANEHQRSSIAEGLGRARHEPATQALIRLAKDPDDYVRLTSATALGLVGSPPAIDALLGMLNDQGKMVGPYACRALGRARALRAADALFQQLINNDQLMAPEAAIALADLRDATVVARLIALLKHGDPDVRGSARFALGKCRDPRALDALLEQLQDAPESVGTVLAIGQTHDPRGFEPLFKLWCQAKHDDERRSAIPIALGEVYSPLALEKLSPFAADPSALRRADVAMALGYTRDEAAVELLKKLVNDRDEKVRDAAVYALSHLACERSRTVLIEVGARSNYLQNHADDRRVQDELLALAKGTHAPHRGKPPIQPTVTGAADAPVTAAAQSEREGALRVMRSSDPRLGALAAELLRDPDVKIRRATVEMIDGLKDPLLAAHLTPLLKDSDMRVRLAAAGALRRNWNKCQPPVAKALAEFDGQKLEENF